MSEVAWVASVGLAGIVATLVATILQIKAADKREDRQANAIAVTRRQDLDLAAFDQEVAQIRKGVDAAILVAA